MEPEPPFGAAPALAKKRVAPQHCRLLCPFFSSVECKFDRLYVVSSKVDRYNFNSESTVVLYGNLGVNQYHCEV